MLVCWHSLNSLVNIYFYAIYVPPQILTTSLTQTYFKFWNSDGELYDGYK